MIPSWGLITAPSCRKEVLKGSITQSHISFAVLSRSHKEDHPLSIEGIGCECMRLSRWSANSSKNPQRRGKLSWILVVVSKYDVLTVMPDLPSTADWHQSSDPLAFQWLCKAPETCRGVTFVDVDYPQLIAKKLDVISSNPHLHTLLNDVEKFPASSGLLLRSKHYIAVGCDLNTTAELDGICKMELDISRCLVLCTAEVSVTYMDTNSANKLIRWAASYKDSM